MGRARAAIVRRKKDSPHWHYDWSVGGLRFRGSTKTADRAEAERIAIKLREDAVKHVVLGERPIRHLTLNEGADRYFQEHARHLVSAKGEDVRLAHIVRVLGEGTLLAELGTAEVVTYLTRRMAEVTRFGRPPGSGTLAGEWQTLGKLLRRARGVWGVTTQDIDASAFRRLIRQPRGRETFLSREQAEALIEALVPHARPVVRFALLTGLRRSNDIGLKWEEVSLPRRQVTLVVKGGKPHTVHLVQEAVDLLLELEPDPARRQRGPVFMFANPNVPCPCTSCRMRPRPMLTIQTAFDKARVRAGLPTVRFHDLRHTVASWLLGRGYGLKIVKEVLGHSSITTTARYAHLEPGAEREAMERALSRAPAKPVREVG